MTNVEWLGILLFLVFVGLPALLVLFKNNAGIALTIFVVIFIPVLLQTCTAPIA